MTVFNTVEIEGFAAPYGVANTYNELLLPRAFQMSIPRYPIPMLFEHDWGTQIGEWHQVWENQAGIWVRGRLDPFWSKTVSNLKWKMPDLSISWRPVQRAALTSNRDLRASCGWPQLNVESSMIEQLSEISLTASGAYPRTYWRELITET